LGSDPADGGGMLSPTRNHANYFIKKAPLYWLRLKVHYVKNFL
jgi:hypothetical protein